MTRALPILALVLLLATAAIAPLLRQFRVDSSTDSLVLEEDPESSRYDRISLLFTSDEFVLVGVTRDDLFTPAGVAYVASLHQTLAAVEGVDSVLSITSVPLMRSFSQPVPPLVAAMKKATLLSPGIDLAKARAELCDHELFANNIISPDGETTGLLVNLRRLPASEAALEKRLRLLDRKATARERLAAATEPGQREAAQEALRTVAAEQAAFRPEWVRTEDARKAERIRIVEDVRAIVRAERAKGVKTRASGVPSIVVEMVEAIEGDLGISLALSAAFLLVFLGAVFRRPRWVGIPLVITAATAAWTVVLMYAQGKRITVITSNVPALLLVIGMAHAIHLIVRYREDLALQPDAARPERVRRVVRSLVWPCLFTATTTCAGFASLYFAGSRPIIDFGFSMALGVMLAFAFSFVILPGALLVLPANDQGRLERSAQALEGLGRASLQRRGLVLGLAALLTAVSAAGMARIKVEARFIDYFTSSSPIHQGLTFIDQRLGGTSGLEVVLQGEDAGTFGFTQPQNLDRAAEVVAWLNDRPEVGAVMSYVGFIDEVRKSFPQATRGQAAGLLARVLEPAMLEPYVVTKTVDVAGRTVRPFSAIRIRARARETDPALDRDALIHDLRAFLAEKFPADGGIRAEVTGMFVLYANMLNSLVGSQITTSLVALAAIWLMLSLLFRNPFAATLALVPNLLPITFVLGAMGWFGIPLDMATVMIASVALGIGVDCAIHYVFRYREEVARDGDVQAALVRSHGSIGTSIFYTSLTTVVGFSVLVTSTILPNAYFGLFTAVAMVVALFAMLTVLPVLIAITRPFRVLEAEGREG